MSPRVHTGTGLETLGDTRGPRQLSKPKNRKTRKCHRAMMMVMSTQEVMECRLTCSRRSSRR